MKISKRRAVKMLCLLKKAMQHFEGLGLGYFEGQTWSKMAKNHHVFACRFVWKQNFKNLFLYFRTVRLTVFVKY